jgi:hypothetical protein
VFVDKNTKVIVQGFTVGEGRLHKLMNPGDPQRFLRAPGFPTIEPIKRRATHEGGRVHERGVGRVRGRL